jgi:hypothetical protein
MLTLLRISPEILFWSVNPFLDHPLGHHLVVSTESNHVRQDSTLSAKLGASVLLPGALTLDLSCRYSDTHSTVELRDYHRVVTTAALVYKF